MTVGVGRDVGERVWRRVWRVFLQRYFESASESALDDLGQRFEVLAEIEICGQMCANCHSDLDWLTDGQRKRFVAGIQRIEEVLPRVTRLDF